MTIHCDIYIRKGVMERNVVTLKSEIPEGMTEAAATRWIHQLASEKIPKPPDEKPHRD